MRTIKFRAWDTEKKEWINRTNENPFWIIGETTVFDLLKQYSIKDFNNIDIQQYTGLKDKKNKEIYEGDIVKINGYGCNNFTAEIYWESVSGGFRTKNYYEEDTFEHSGSSMEIIGNIYENKNLLDNEYCNSKKWKHIYENHELLENK